MVDFFIGDFDPKIHRALKLLAFYDGTSMRAIVERAIKVELKRAANAEKLKKMADRGPEDNEEVLRDLAQKINKESVEPEVLVPPEPEKVAVEIPVQGKLSAKHPTGLKAVLSDCRARVGKLRKK
jgi:hypothetical protein